MTGITKARKWTFDTTTDNTIVHFFYLSNEEIPYTKVPLLLVGEQKIKQKVQEKDILENDDFRKQIMKVGVKVDVVFDSKKWYCGEISKVGEVQVTVKFFNNDKDVRLKPIPNQIRPCSHSPQLKEFSI